MQEGPRIIVIGGHRYRIEWSDLPGVVRVSRDAGWPVGLAVATGYLMDLESDDIEALTREAEGS